MNELVNKKNLKVFVHCTSGISRSATVILAYLCLFKRVQGWEQVATIREFVRSHSHPTQANLAIVQHIINDNRDFQARQIDIKDELDQKRKDRIKQYEQKNIILQELEREEEERRKKEIIRQQQLAERKQRNAEEQKRLDNEMQNRMKAYKQKIDDEVRQREKKIEAEHNRL